MHNRPPSRQQTIHPAAAASPLRAGAALATWSLLTAALAALLAAPPAGAHNPHDPVEVLALSPAYSEDGTLFTSRLPGDNFRLHEAIVSQDGGWTWSAMPSGLDNRSDFTSIVVSPEFSDDGTVFCSTEQDGMFRSQDRGAHWSRVGEGILPEEIITAATAVDGQGRLVVFVAGLDGGLFRSIDGGETWEQVIDVATSVASLAPSPDMAVDRTVFAASFDGSLLASLDDGATWEDRGEIQGAGKISDVVPVPGYASSGEVLVGTRRGGVRISTDFGFTFEPLGAPAVPGPAVELAVSPAWPTDRTAWMVTRELGVFRTVDGGGSWQLFPTGIDHSRQGRSTFGLLRVSDDYASDRTVFLGTFDGLFKSTDGGETWMVQFIRPPSVATGIAVSRSPGQGSLISVSTYGGGAYVSQDGGESWVPASIGLPSSTVYDVAYPWEPLEETIYSGVRNYIAQWDDAGTVWDPTRLGGPQTDVTPTEIALPASGVGPGHVVVGTRRRGLLGSPDAGRTWTQLTPEGKIIKVSSVALASDSVLILGTWDGLVMRSVDAGANWTDLPIPLTDDPVYVAASPDFASDGRAYVGTSAGLFRSDDGGDTLVEDTSHPVLEGAAVQWIRFSPFFAGDRTLFVGLRGHGLLRSTDGGASWAVISQLFLSTGVHLTDLEFSPDYPEDGTLYGEAGSMLLRSRDRGTGWEEISLPSVRHEDTRQFSAARDMRYSEGDWMRAVWPGASSGAYHLAARPGATVELDFYGTRVAWIGARGERFGIAEVWIDGEMVAEVDQYSPTPMHSEVLFVSSPLAGGPHRIALRVTDRTHPDATGTGTVLDAFDVER